MKKQQQQPWLRLQGRIQLLGYLVKNSARQISITRNPVSKHSLRLSEYMWFFEIMEKNGFENRAMGRFDT